LLRRQASEQYFTSAQFFAQRRRQLIGRPQAAHGLLGSAALLPRWVVPRTGIMVSRKGVALTGTYTLQSSTGRFDAAWQSVSGA